MKGRMNQEGSHRRQGRVPTKRGERTGRDKKGESTKYADCWQLRRPCVSPVCCCAAEAPGGAIDNAHKFVSRKLFGDPGESSN